jgi:RNA polymerase sigma factor (sigma-70 family)
LKDGQHKTLKILELHGLELHRLLTRLTVRPDAAEELLQELFINLSGSRAFLNATEPKAYAFRSAINLAMQWRRKNVVRAVQIDEKLLPAMEDRICEHIQNQEMLRLVLDAIGHLSEGMRNIIVSHYLEQRSYQEIAEGSKTEPGHIRVMCSRGINKIRSVISKRQQHLNSKENVQCEK